MGNKVKININGENFSVLQLQESFADATRHAKTLASPHWGKLFLAALKKSQSVEPIYGFTGPERIKIEGTSYTEEEMFAVVKEYLMYAPNATLAEFKAALRRIR